MLLYPRANALEKLNFSNLTRFSPSSLTSMNNYWHFSTYGIYTHPTFILQHAPTTVCVFDYNSVTSIAAEKKENSKQLHRILFALYIWCLQQACIHTHHLIMPCSSRVYMHSSCVHDFRLSINAITTIPCNAKLYRSGLNAMTIVRNAYFHSDKLKCMELCLCGGSFFFFGVVGLCGLECNNKQQTEKKLYARIEVPLSRDFFLLN